MIKTNLKAQEIVFILQAFMKNGLITCNEKSITEDSTVNLNLALNAKNKKMKLNMITKQRDKLNEETDQDRQNI